MNYKDELVTCSEIPGGPFRVVGQRLGRGYLKLQLETPDGTRTVDARKCFRFTPPPTGKVGQPGRS